MVKLAMRVVPLLLVAGGGCVAETAAVDEETSAINGGVAVPQGQLEAVGRLGIFAPVCNGTLVGDRVVLTAAHCVCPTLDSCMDRYNILFTDVRPASNPNTRTDVFINGDVIVHPDVGIGDPPNAPPDHAPRNDLAVIRLDTPASSSAIVSPITISGALPAVDSNVTMVGYGPTNDAGGECNDFTPIKRQATTPLDQIIAGPAGDLVLRVDDDTIHGCGGDSGGALVDAQGHLAGVTSAGDSASFTLFRATPAYAEWIGLQATSPGGRVGVWNLSGTAPAAPVYADKKPDPDGLLGWIDPSDLQLLGDFMGRGHDQVLYVNTGGSDGFIRIADYADGVGPTESPFWLNYGVVPGLTGWFDANDVKLAGDFLRRGHDQLLLINNSGTGGRVLIVDFASGSAQLTLFESYGQSTLLNGWHDPGDGVLVGDFFGDGYDTVLFVNRGSGAGRILIADFRDGATPVGWRYYEAYADGPQLNGWHDANDLMFAGDFRGLGHDQVLFINRGSTGNRVLVADFSDGAFPAEWKLVLDPTHATALNGFIDTEDRALAGRFRGARDQLALVNRTSAGLDRVRIVDFSGSALSVPFNETQVATAGLVPRAIDATDRVLAGDVRGSGTDQLVTIEALEQ